MDAGGIRPAAIGMAERLAGAGYVVLLPDLFYRHGPYGPFDPKALFKGDVRAVLGPLMATTGNAAAAKDNAAFLAFLDTRADVTGDKVGAVGFCMGGGMAIAAAGTHPARFAAVCKLPRWQPRHRCARQPAHLRLQAQSGVVHCGRGRR